MAGDPNKMNNPKEGLEKKMMEEEEKKGKDEKGKKKEKRLVFDKSLGTAAGLSKLLPTGTTLAFQTMAPSFTNGGECEDHDVNFAFTWGLIAFLTSLCALLSFTDSVTDKLGRTYYGVATPRGFQPFNHSLQDLLPQLRPETRQGLQRMRWRWQDWLHAVMSAAVFVALAFCDAGVQRCLVPSESRPWHDFLTHLPLAVGFLASFVFVVFPSARKGIGEEGAWDDDDHTDTTTGGGGNEAADDSKKSPPPAAPQSHPMTVGTAVANLSKLLPTGTTLAFQTMAPSFTKGGDCSTHGVNYAFTWGLIVLLTSLCALLCFTDSVTDDAGHTCYGRATVCGFRFFDHLCEQELRLPAAELEALKRKKKLRGRDFLHALTSASVFLAIAFCDAGVQRCLVPSESNQWQQFLAILPLAASFLASFIFLIFPSTRKGIGEEGAWVDTVKSLGLQEHKSTTTTNNDKQSQSSNNPKAEQNQSAAMGSSTRVAPSTSFVELEPLV